MPWARATRTEGADRGASVFAGRVAAADAQRRAVPLVPGARPPRGPAHDADEPGALQRARGVFLPSISTETPRGAAQAGERSPASRNPQISDRIPIRDFCRINRSNPYRRFADTSRPGKRRGKRPGKGMRQANSKPARDFIDGCNRQRASFAYCAMHALRITPRIVEFQSTTPSIASPATTWALVPVPCGAAALRRCRSPSARSALRPRGAQGKLSAKRIVTGVSS